MALILSTTIPEHSLRKIRKYLCLNVPLQGKIVALEVDYAQNINKKAKEGEVSMAWKWYKSGLKIFYVLTEKLNTPPKQTFMKK